MKGIPIIKANSDFECYPVLNHAVNPMSIFSNMQTLMKWVQIESTFQDGIPQGKTTVISMTGVKKTVWLDRYGKLSDGGELVVAMDGTIYAGEVYNQAFNGIGYMILPNGSVYEGEFVNDKFHGRGRLTRPNGAYSEGVFRYDKFVG